MILSPFISSFSLCILGFLSQQLDVVVHILMTVDLNVKGHCIAV